MRTLDAFNFNFYAIYAVFSVVAILFAMYVDIKKKHYNVISRYVALALLMIFGIFFGMRDLYIGSDTEMYKWMFLKESNNEYGIQIIFKYLILSTKIFTQNYQIFLLIISLLYVGILFWSLHEYVQKVDANFFLLAFTFASLYFFRQLGINIVRQGVALSLVLLAVSFYFKDPKNVWKWVFPFIIAVGFHFATLIIFLFFAVVVLVKKASMTFYYLWYFILLIISALGGSILSLGSFLNYFVMVDSKKSDYYLKGVGAEEYIVGFKAQFAAFNTIFLLIFSFINYYMLKNEDGNYKLLLKYYMLISGLFFMMFQLPFSDRYGVMSWVTIPFLVAPLYSIKNNSWYAIPSTLFFIGIFIFFNVYNA